MAGIPAGFEDNFYDDDDDDLGNFDYDEKDYTKCMNEEGIASVADSNKNTKPSVFNQFRTVPKDLSERLSLDSEKIRIAVIEGKIDFLRKALKEGFQPDTPLRSGWPALLYASSYGMYDIIELLIEHKASVNKKTDTISSLMVVSQSTNKGEDNLVSCAELLIESGGNVNDHDKHIMTPLMYAAQRGLSKLVKLFCEKGAAVDMQDSRGMTALCFAAVNGYNHVAKVLLEKHANHQLATQEGQTPADLAFSNGYSMLSGLLEKFDGSSADSIANLPNECSTLSNDKSSKYVNYGDLELFLFGLELGHLVSVFQDQHLTFAQLLKLNECELSEAGVTKLGDKKKLHSALQNVRTNEWDTSKLTKESMAKLTILETAAVIANITKHANCIQSCVAFVRKSVAGKSQDLSNANSSLQKTLSEQSEEAYRVSKTFAKEVNSLHKELKQILPKTFPPEPHFIGEVKLDELSNKNSTSSSSKKVFYKVTVVALLGVSAFGVYKWLQNR